MDDITNNMLSVLPPLFIGGALLMLTDKFIRQPVQKKKKCFDEQEYKDLKPRGKKLGFGDFSNINW